MGLREDAKQARRQNIVLAARNMMRETGDSGFSMRILARKAGVSIATPYNLFGSKQEILYAVLDADLASYQERLGALRVDPLERIFRSITVATSLYSEQPGFYRAVLVALYKDSGSELRTMFSGPRQVVMQNLVRNAKLAGYLRSSMCVDAVARNLSYVFFAGILEWVSGLISLSEFEVRVQYGVGLTLSGAASEEHRHTLDSRVGTLQQQLANSEARPKQRIRLRPASYGQPETLVHTAL